MFATLLGMILSVGCLAELRLPTLVHEARQFMEEGEYQPAIDRLSIVLCFAPEQAEFWFLRGMAYGCVSNSEAMHRDMEKSYKLLPLQARLMEQEVARLWYQDEMSQAKEMLLQAIDEYPENIFFLNMLGAILLKEERFKEASTYLNKSISLCPRNNMAFAYRAYLHVEQGNGKLLEHDLQMITPWRPDDFNVLVLRAAHYEAVGKYREAILANQQLIKLEPYVFRHRLNEIDCLLKSKQLTHYAAFDEKARQTEAVLTQNEMAIYYLWRANHCHEYFGEQSEALELISLAVSLDPELLERGRVLRGMIAYAIEDYTTVIDYLTGIKDEYQGQILFRLAVARIQMNRELERAIHEMLQAIALTDGRREAWRLYLCQVLHESQLAPELLLEQTQVLLKCTPAEKHKPLLQYREAAHVQLNGNQRFIGEPQLLKLQGHDKLVQVQAGWDSLSQERNRTIDDALVLTHAYVEIPIVVPGTVIARANRLVIYYSTDEGKSWQRSVGVDIHDKQFLFMARHDGTYHLGVAIIDKNGQEVPANKADLRTHLKLHFKTNAVVQDAVLQSRHEVESKPITLPPTMQPPVPPGK